eukprot:1138045-Pelagomonas_calceolata.AAC.2
MEGDACFLHQGTLASLDDVNYRIPRDNSQVGIREVEAPFPQFGGPIYPLKGLQGGWPTARESG